MATYYVSLSAEGTTSYWYVNCCH